MPADGLSRVGRIDDTRAPVQARTEALSPIQAVLTGSGRLSVTQRQAGII